MAITDKKVYARMSNRFRRARNVALGEMIAAAGAPRILDVGGMPDFWATVPNSAAAAEIVIINSEAGEHSSMDSLGRQPLAPNMSVALGDACDLKYADGEFDLLVCNSVLEHVGGWANQQRAAAELVRVGRRGWVQVPAYEFPLEVHYMRPFVHWMGEPMRAAVLRRTVKRFGDFDAARFREMFDYVQLLSRGEMAALFPDAELRRERFAGFTKSHIAVW